jgi:hypothetical protein
MARRQRINTTRLLDRDYEILEHLMTYRVTTREVLHRQFFADSELNAVSKVTTRLTEKGIWPGTNSSRTRCISRWAYAWCKTFRRSGTLC